MAKVETWRGQLETFLPMTDFLSAPGNGGGCEWCSKSHHKQHQPPLITGGPQVGDCQCVL